MSRSARWPVVASAVLLLITAASMAFGVKVWNVSSGSMEPAYRAGDAVLTVADTHLRTGSVYLYSPGPQATPVMHRLAGVDMSGRLVFRGDANTAADGPVTADSVLGRVVAQLPGAGVLVWLGPTMLMPALTLLTVVAVAAVVFKLRPASRRSA